MKASLYYCIIIFTALFSIELIAQNQTNSIFEEEVNSSPNTQSPILFSNKDIYIEHIRPNPANDLAFFYYQLLNKSTGAKIVMHNVLGGLVNEYLLDYDQTQLKIRTHNLKPGVYFYTLYLKNENLITKKVIIKR